MKRFFKTYKKKIILSFACILGVFCLYQVIYNYEWHKISQALQKANFFILFFGSVISIISYWFFRALRWKILLSNEQLEISLRKIYLITATSVGLSTITPFQSGEALKVEYLKRYGADKFSGYGIFILERFLDLFVVLGLGLVGVAISFDRPLLQNYLYLFASLLILGILTTLVGIFRFPFPFLQPIRTWLIERWNNKYLLFTSLVLTFLSWMAVIFGWHFCLQSVSIEVDFIHSTTVVSLTTLLSILSFIPGAIGVSELSISGILLQLGISSSTAQTGAIAVRIYTTIILILTLFHWLLLSLTTKRESVSMKSLPN